MACGAHDEARSQDQKEPVLRGSYQALAGTSDAQELRLAPDVVVTVGADGELVLPERARNEAGTTAATADAANELSFTFDSTDDPWTPEELTRLHGWIDAIYPVLRALYGAPAFANTVNVRKGGEPAGQYFPSTNEIWLGPSGFEGDVLCHELVHAFHDDFIVGMASWEEGMARALEIEVTKRVGIPAEQDHGYGYDVYYEALNRPEVGAYGGYIFAGWNQVVMRYQLAGYAWAKPMIEDEGFFVRFNAALYEEARVRPEVTGAEGSLVRLAAAASATVEGRPFVDWYAAQHVLNTRPPTGTFLFFRNSGIYGLYITPLRRDESGAETNLTSDDVQWIAKDDVGNVIDTGTGVDVHDPELVNYWSTSGYVGRIEVTATGTLEGAPYTSTIFDKASPGTGVFGVVIGANEGVVTLTALDATSEPVEAVVQHGAFEVPALSAVRGRMQYVFTNSSGLSAPGKTFTKDDAPYFLPIDVRSAACDAKVDCNGICDGPGVETSAGCCASGNVDCNGQCVHRPHGPKRHGWPRPHRGHGKGGRADYSD